MERGQIVQSMLSLFPSPSYLEIGVQRGTTFSAVRAARKVGVDPRFLFNARAMMGADKTATLHEVTSDVYFGEVIDENDHFDVIFIDGLHTSEQTYRDFVNATRFLSPSGVIVIDDVTPFSYAASLPDYERTRAMRAATGDKDKAWMGDVYRVVFMIDAFHQQYGFATVVETMSQLIVWNERRVSAEIPSSTIQQLGGLPFEHTIIERSLYRPYPLKEIEARLRKRHQ